MNSSVACPDPHFSTGSPTCVLLGEPDPRRVGGKAAGLAQLLGIGLAVPPGFVVVNAAPGELPQDLEEHYQRVTKGGAVAVRSSAVGEDSAEASFAGQHETFLEVRGSEALREAIERSLCSTESSRAKAYWQERHSGAHGKMCVVVQSMVEARAAGVLFTADPHSGRRDRFIIDAVRGLGESLVSGRAQPDHYEVTPAGAIIARDLVGEVPLLSDDELRALAADAQRALAAAGRPLDMEWALDADGRHYWLQARPITALPSDPQEFDALQDPSDIYTSGNIGECMPGALTPLSISTVWKADDYGLQRMQQRCGLRQQSVPEYHITRVYFGHLFFNMNELGRMSTRILGASDKAIGLAICGRVVPELDTGPQAPFLGRLLHSVSYARYILSGKRAQAALEDLERTLAFPDEERALAMYEAIDAELPTLYESFDLHITSSAGAGALEPALLGVLAHGELPSEQHHAELAALLAASSEHDVESANIVTGIAGLIEQILTVPEAAARFAKADPAAAWAWLSRDTQSPAGAALRDFMQRHGHRCLRELELREQEWSANPLPLVASLQVAVRARLAGGTTARPLPAAPPEVSRGLRQFVRVVQSAVRRREHTKSLLVKVVTRFKVAYRRLGLLLVREGQLPDDDAVFFLTHKELGQLVRGHQAAWAERIAGRRLALEYQAMLRFPDIFSGSPEPLSPVVKAPSGSRALRGKPVSRGRVTGRARVAHSLADAAALEAGEILISPVTDIGWTPYFSLIKGLATDVGSSVSHGAVVAREYGLPAVVDLRSATQVFKTGDYVALDGNAGLLELADEEHSEG